ncbi:hypothetical protein JNB_10224 [Janibacter sp. HTCC2649]|uniref:hypothetical protein n=1 Tax=Janibacter sp. HTCC2649 TaxID=313589 RepID=UPI000067088C|nr:hypothetical protein [Janibacter sp. HTCC2649]EAQ00542.1 hypothetical protein JNB_10224 [Janibacter sp. HTCC2649]
MLPWVVEGTEAKWGTADDPESQISTGPDGIRTESALIPWDDVLSLRIEVPTTSRRVAHGLQWLDLLLGQGESELPVEAITFTLSRRRQEQVLTVPSQEFDWRINIALRELLDVLGRQVRLMGDVHVLDAAVRATYRQIPRRARMLMRTDLFGLERQFGGWASTRRAIEKVVTDVTPCRPADDQP